MSISIIIEGIKEPTNELLDFVAALLLFLSLHLFSFLLRFKERVDKNGSNQFHDSDRDESHEAHEVQT